MSLTDAPDWQRVVVTVASGGVTQDAPDWQNTIVAPGGTPVGGSLAIEAGVLSGDIVLAANATVTVFSIPLTAGKWQVTAAAAIAQDVSASSGTTVYLQPAAGAPITQEGGGVGADYPGAGVAATTSNTQFGYYVATGDGDVDLIVTSYGGATVKALSTGGGYATGYLALKVG